MEGKLCSKEKNYAFRFLLSQKLSLKDKNSQGTSQKQLGFFYTVIEFITIVEQDFFYNLGELERVESRK